MSDSSGISMCAVLLPNQDPASLTQLSEALTTAWWSNAMSTPSSLGSAAVPHRLKPRMLMSGTTRGDWFQDCLDRLIRASGIGNLSFLTGKSWTNQHFACDSGSYSYGYRFRYTVIRSQDELTTAIYALNRLLAWCRAHPDATAAVTDYVDAAGVLESIEGAFFTLSPNSEVAGDEGQGPDFLFCVLHTVGDLLRYAKHWKGFAVFGCCHYIGGAENAAEMD